MTICLACNREMRKFQEYRTNLVENQRKLKEMLRKDENLIVIDSMAEIVPEIFNNDDDVRSLNTDSTISQNEIEILNDSEIFTTEVLQNNSELHSNEVQVPQIDIKTIEIQKTIPKIINVPSQNNQMISKLSQKSTKKKIVLFPSESKSSKLISEIFRRSQLEKAKRYSNRQLNELT
ncbi:hypothetical protein ACKWTF_016468 [Chironomus riparius]